jgi:poly-gamma-glutamate system protein
MRKRTSVRTLYLCGGLSLLSWLALKITPVGAPADRSEMVLASRMMAESQQTLRTCREREGLGEDPRIDLNRTGLIGIESSPITTTLGSVEAKRTTTNPDFAGLIVLLLKEAGVEKGDTIAVGASGSFPGLILAVCSASRALRLETLVICSLGASQWGANDPRFTWLEMARCIGIGEAGTLRMIAATIGGDADIGKEMNEEGRRLLLDSIRRSGLPPFQEPDLKLNVRQRLDLYERSAGGKTIKAFVNIGGSWANMGTDASVLNIKPGVVRAVRLPPPGRRGVLQEMAGRGVPVIHLLNIGKLAERYGLPWDPSPLPAPGEGAIYRRAERTERFFLIVCAFYLAAVAVALAADSRASGHRRQGPGA